MRLYVFLLLSVTALWGADAAYTVGPKGLTSLTWNNWQFLGDPSYQGEFNLYGAGATLRHSNGTTADGGGNPARSSSGDTVTQTFPWGRIASTWTKLSADRIGLRITVTNTSTNGDAITALEGNLLVLDFPIAPPVQDVYGNGLLSDNPRTIDPVVSPPFLVIGLDTIGTLTLGSLSVSVEDDRGCVTFSANHQIEVRVAGPAIVGDVNGDGVVEAIDLNLVRGQFGRTGAAISPLSADLDGNDRVDAADLGIVARAITP